MASFFLILVSLYEFVVAGAVKKHRDAIKAGNSDKRIDDATHQRCRSTENRGYKVILKKSDQSPIETANDEKCKENFVEYVHVKPPFPIF